jgi:hypothetical protein
MAGPIPIPTDAMDVGGGRRLSLAPDALWLENRSGSAYVRIRPITYDQIQTVYTYETRDWSMVGYMALLALFLLMVTFIGLASANVNIGPLYSLLIVLVLGGAPMGWGIYHSISVPRKMLRIDTHTGSVIVSNRQPRFSVTLGQHIEATRARGPARPAAPAVAPPYAPPSSPGYAPPAGPVSPPIPGGFVLPPPPMAPGVPPPPPTGPSPTVLPPPYRSPGPSESEQR